MRSKFNVLPSLVFSTLLLIGSSLTGCVSPDSSIHAGNPVLEKLNRPVVPEAIILSTAEKAAVAVFTYNYSNYPVQMQKASHYFTPSAWQLYEKTYIQSGNIARIEKNKFDVVGSVAGPVVVLEKGNMNGYYMWKVKVPLLVKYQNSEVNEVQHITSTLLIAQTVVHNTQDLQPSIVQMVSTQDTPTNPQG